MAQRVRELCYALRIEARFSGVPLGIGTLIGMRLRKVSPPAIVRPLIAATKAGIELTFPTAAAIELAGRDVDVGRNIGAELQTDQAEAQVPLALAFAFSSESLTAGAPEERR